MLHIVLKDIKNMFKHPIMLTALLLGIVIASASMIMYYVMGSKRLNINNNSIAQEQTVEVKGYGTSDSEINGILSLIEEDRIPEVWYIYAVDYSSDEYDLLGFKQYGNDFTIKIGEMLNDGDSGHCLVSANWIKERTIEIGESISIRGHHYTVKGINPDFDPLMYDIRRLQPGIEFVAGSDSIIERDDEVKDRPSKVAIIPLEDFSENIFPASIYHIVFSQPITMDQRAEIEELFSTELGLNEFTDMTAFIETNSTVQWSESAIYLAAVIAGVINIISLFAYFLRENKRQYAIYKLVGASNIKIIAIMLIELFLYTIAGFIIGTAGAIPLITNLSLFSKTSPPSFEALFILFIMIYISAVFICFGQIISILHKKSEKKKKSKHAIMHLSEGDISIGNRFVYLLSYQYKKKNTLNVISLIFLSIAVAFSFTYAMTYVFESGKYDNYYKINYKYDFGIVSLSDDYIGRLNEDILSQKISSAEQDAQTVTLIEKLKDIEGVNDVSIISLDTIGIYDVGHYKSNEEYLSFLTQYSSKYIDSIDMPMSQGNWEAMRGYDPSDENAVIPCVVTQQKAQKYPFGSEFTAVLNFDTGFKEVNIDDDGTVNTIVESLPVERNFKVVGVVDESAYVFAPSCQVYHCDREEQDVSVLMPKLNNNEALSTDIIAPIIYHEGKRMFSPYSYDFFVYGDKGMNNDMKEAIHAAAAPNAEVFFFSTAIENYNKLFSTGGGNIYVFHSIISGLLLIFGIGGFSLIQFAMNRRTYGVYYTCGMSWEYSIKLILMWNALNTLLPAIAGAYLGIIMAMHFRDFMARSIVLSMLCGVGVVAIILILTGIAITFYVKKKKPKSLLTEDAK